MLFFCLNFFKKKLLKYLNQKTSFYYNSFGLPIKKAIKIKNLKSKVT